MFRRARRRDGPARQPRRAGGDAPSGGFWWQCCLWRDVIIPWNGLRHRPPAPPDAFGGGAVEREHSRGCDPLPSALWQLLCASQMCNSCPCCSCGCSRAGHGQRNPCKEDLPVPPWRWVMNTQSRVPGLAETPESGHFLHVLLVPRQTRRRCVNLKRKVQQMCGFFPHNFIVLNIKYFTRRF